MGSTPIALGMYTVHQDVLLDMPGTFQKLAAMGYQGIEFYGEPADYAADTVRRSLEGSGLALTSWHIEWRNLQPATIAGTIQYLKSVGCKRAVVPCLGGKWNVAHMPEQESRPLWEDYTVWLNAVALRLAEHGIAAGYHNHEHEFMLKYDGERVFDILLQRLEPSIIMELDTGNAIEGGADPADELLKYKGRPVLLHCKPYSRKDGFNVTLGAPGDLNDWKAILSACKKDSLAYIVESESSVGAGLDNARACIEGLKALL
jgi:sugar phosphate isomerase/epimerase